MEKLQAAIEKARTQRQDGMPARSGREIRKAATSSVGTLWEALPLVHISSDLARKNRIVSFQGGKEAGPYDMLRTRVLQQATANNWTRVALVSPHSACGKTTTIANLVFSFGRQTDLHTMMFDFDLRRIELGKLLGIQPKHAMGDVLNGDVDFADHAVRIGPNVALGLNNKTISNSAEILQSSSTQDRLNEIQAAYQPDIMLFDLPPLMVSDDNFGFLKNVDCAILLVEAEKTTVKQIDQAERQLAELTNVMGIGLNKSHYTSDGYGYGYGYG